MFMNPSRIGFILGLVVSGLGLQLAAAELESDSLVTTKAGDLPIILSAPHGGREAIAGVPERRGQGVKLFNPESDSGTDRLTLALADAIEKKTGKRPFLVIARFHRKYVDANRPPVDAYEAKEAKPTYEAYHHALAEARQQVVRRWGHGILLDIHGQGAESKSIFRGTHNGKTTTHLISRFGPEAISGKKGLFGQLAEQGFAVIPAVDSTDRETRYEGGYTVQTYGSAVGGTLDAIQLEFGKDLRTSETAETAAKLANSIASFAQTYLPKTEQQPGTGQQKRAVRVGVYRDVGAGPSVNDLLRSLKQFEDVTVREMTADDIRSGALSSVDVLIQPGGSGGSQGRHLGEEGRTKIRTFIDQGGGFIGICAGAYLATADYPWSLNVLDAKVVDRKHWARGTGMVEITLTDAGQQVLNSKERQLNIHYAQGPLLAPGEKEDIPDYEAIALYKTEIAENGAPAGVMAGTTAVARGRFGGGRVFCFSPHPEMTKGLEPLVRYAIEDVKRSIALQKVQQRKIE